nr:hypothetical protein [Burkholderia oklahomensis]
MAGIDSVEHDDFFAFVPVEKSVVRQIDTDRIEALGDLDIGDRRGRDQLKDERLLSGQILCENRLLAAIPEEYFCLVGFDAFRRFFLTLFSIEIEAMRARSIFAV